MKTIFNYFNIPDQIPELKEKPNDKFEFPLMINHYYTGKELLSLLVYEEQVDEIILNKYKYPSDILRPENISKGRHFNDCLVNYDNSKSDRVKVRLGELIEKHSCIQGIINPESVVTIETMKGTVYFDGHNQMKVVEPKELDYNLNAQNNELANDSEFSYYFIFSKNLIIDKGKCNDNEWKPTKKQTLREYNKHITNSVWHQKVMKSSYTSNISSSILRLDVPNSNALSDEYKGNIYCILSNLQ